MISTNRTRCSPLALAAAGMALAAAALWMQTGPAMAQAPGKAEGKKGGKKGFGPMLDPLAALDDRAGFEPIFNGTSLDGWDGDPQLWRAENGSIIGETTAANPLKANTFLIWRGGKPGDFELKLDVKMNSTNSGIQYRSVEIPERGKWALKGYQADIDFENRYSGQLYEEQGRGFLAMRGQFTTKAAGSRPRVIAHLKPNEDLKGYLNINGWNTMHIIARGNLLTHIVNGQLMAQFLDDDAEGRAMSGLIGLQIHVGPPMKLEVRNVGLKKL